MHAARKDVLILGAGVFGLSAARELARRGLRVRLLESGSLARPEAASIDTSRIVRREYGTDVFYTDLVERCLPAWRAWREYGGRPLFEECGVLFLGTGALREGSFERSSWDVGRSRGHALERLAETDRARFPAFPSVRFPDGFFDPEAGWARAAAACLQLAREARALGVELYEGRRARAFVERDGRVHGVVTDDGRAFHADVTVVAGGAWTTALLPELADRLEVRAQPVFYLQPRHPERFRPPHFPVWAIDLARHGFYGFPADERGIVKIGHHGRGRPVDPDAPREVTPADRAGLEAFLGRFLPELADAELVGARTCLYTDSCDGDFWIDHHPQRPGVFVATGGSGHAFKFLPRLGALVADRLLAGEGPERFAWRAVAQRREQARGAGEPLADDPEPRAATAPSESSWEAARRALTEEDVERLARLVTETPDLLHAVGEEDPHAGWTLLHVAVDLGRIPAVERLLDLGADPDAMAGALETTPLGLAAELGAADLVALLAERGAGLDGLRDAAALGRLEVLAAPFPTRLEPLADLLPEHEAEDVERTVHQAFQLACLNGREATAHALLDLALGADEELAESIDLEIGREALVAFLVATRHLLVHSPELPDGLGEWVQEHLLRGDPANLVDVATPDRADQTALDLARGGRHAETVRVLRARTPEAPRRVRPERLARSADGPEHVAFLHACQRADLPRLRAFLDRHPDGIAARTPFGVPAGALLAAHRGRDAREALALLLERGLRDLGPLLRSAAWWGVRENVRFLLDHGAFEASVLAREGLLPAAAATRHNALVELDEGRAILADLLAAGADPTACDGCGRTAFGLADDALRADLVERGVPAEERHPGLRAFQDAVLADERDAVRERAAHDPQLLVFRDDRGNGCTAALHVALRGDEAFARELVALRQGAPELHESVALDDAAGMRRALLDLGVPATGPRFGAEPAGAPLHVAAWCGRLELARELAAHHGYSIAAENDGGPTGLRIGPPPFHDATPFHLAAQRGHTAFVAWCLDLLDAHRLPPDPDE